MNLESMQKEDVPTKVWRLPRNPMLENSSAYCYLLIEESGLHGTIMLTWPNLLALTWHSVSILQAFKPFHFTYAPFPPDSS